MTDRDDLLERAADTLKQPVRIDPDVDRRVMAEIGNLPVPGRASVFEWMRRRRTVRLSPLGGLGLAAGIAALAVAGSMMVRPGAETPVEEIGTGTVIQFVLVAPEAVTVAVVGDFNDWSVSATPLTRGSGDGLWSVTVPLSPGRYRYSFFIDGTTWLKDPRASTAVEDEFGRPNSVVTIGGV